MINTNTEKKTFKLERKQAFLLWEGITKDDFLKSKFYKKFRNCVNFYKKEGVENILTSIKHGKRLNLENCTTEFFIIQNVLPIEIVDNEILNLYGSHRKDNKLPEKLIHEHFVKKEKKSNQEVMQLPQYSESEIILNQDNYSYFSDDQNMMKEIKFLKFSLEKEKAECDRLKGLVKFYENDKNNRIFDNFELNIEELLEITKEADFQILGGDILIETISSKNDEYSSNLKTNLFTSDSGINSFTAKELGVFVNTISKGVLNNKNINEFKETDGFAIPEVNPKLIKRMGNNN